MLERLREAGQTKHLEKGHVLFEIDQDGYDFVYIIEGTVQIVDRRTDQPVAQVEAGHFVGELGMLMGQRTFLAGVVAAAGRYVVVPVPELRRLMDTVPEIGDVIMSAFAARRRLLIERGEGGLVIVGHESDSTALRLREFAQRNQVPHRWVDRDDPDGMATIGEDVPATGTIAITGRSSMLVDPTPEDVARAVGLDLSARLEDVFDVLVVGAGPGGLAAAVYGASEGLDVLVVEDTAIGGQAGTSSRIENYLGFPTGISGTDLAYRGEIQAIKFGARIVAPRRVVGLTRDGDVFHASLSDGRTVSTRSVVLANGVQYRRLPLDRLAEFEGRGVYYAATELEARFCRGTEAVVVGGGNSAGQAAMYLSRTADHVHVVVRGDGLAASMSSYLTDRIDSDPKITLWTRTEICGLGGGDRLARVTLRRNDTGVEVDVDAKALFIMIGAAPNTDWLAGQVELDERGFVLTGQGAGRTSPFATSLPGVFAVGDIRSGSVKRVASAVGEGSVAISAVHEYIATLTPDAT